jgi:hypothetical protein
MKTTRVTNWCAEALSDGDKTLSEIMDYINKRSMHGTTVHALTSIVSKNKMFRKVGSATECRGTTRYKVAVWGLAGGYVRKIKR